MDRRQTTLGDDECTIRHGRAHGHKRNQNLTGMYYTGVPRRQFYMVWPQETVYAFLKVGKSKERTYASLRHIILDIECLLVMRYDPPRSPPPLTAHMSVAAIDPNHRGRRDSNQSMSSTSSILRTIDLGMLVAGERGTVSVRQQLRIIARMCRTYLFLKVISSGIPFSISDDLIF